MTALLLHLSDIHIKTAKDPVLKRAQAIAAATFASLPSASHVFIVVSGDIAYSGAIEEYALASVFFTQLRDAILSEGSSPVSFILAPGNHDCDFKRDELARQVLVDALGRPEYQRVDDSVIGICTAIQQPYFDFRDSFEEFAEADDRLWRTRAFEVEGKRVVFEVLNIPWVSRLKEEPGRLYFPIDRYQSRPLVDADVRLVLLHHPLNWFSQSNYRPFRTFLRRTANIIISGHEHEGAVGVVNDADTETSAYIEGCVLQGDQRNLTDSSFNLVRLDLAQGQFASTRYCWNGEIYYPREEGSWSDYHDLPAKRNNPFAITEVFQDTLDDAGAFFRHPGQRNVGLSDIFVYPDLRKFGNGEDRRRVFFNSSRLLAPEMTAEGVLIEGEEKAGSTSLLHQLYRQYHDRGFVPLLIKGRDIKRTTEADVDALLRRAVTKQYGEEKVAAYFQAERSRKLLLLDDFDHSPLKAGDARAKVLECLRKRFGHLVVTVGEMFEMREMIEGDSSRALLSLEHYQLQPFGFVLRGQLIDRWLSIGADGTLDEATLIERRDRAEKFVNAIMRKAIIPALPLYLLTLLQSMEAGSSGNFKDSALGHYYHFLLTQGFQNAGVKTDQLTEMFQYAGHLAWEFHRNGKRELTLPELRAFNDRFSRHWHRVDFSTRLDLFVSARVLNKVGEDYGFRYPYIFYYLKGRYLSENLADEEIRAYIARCCEHLYVRDHANTVLFLAHHTNDDFVLRSIANTLHNLFPGRSPLRFSGDTGVVNQLIEDAPKLAYSGEKPTEHRKRRNEIEDQLDDGDDGLRDEEEGEEEPSLIAQMTMLFKTTEILGQVLKNQYSTIPRFRKAELLEDLFNGPLRAIRDFYEYFERNPDALATEIDAALKRKGNIEDAEERKAIARKVTAGFIQFVTFGFLQRTSQSIGSENLFEEVQDVVRANGSPAFKMIELGIRLDSPKAIPREELKAIFREVEKDLIANRVIHIMILNRLYMFKTTERDMQWLSQEFKINLEAQHAITYQEKSQRVAR